MGPRGDWTVGGEEAALDQPGGGIVHRFDARDLQFVLGPGPDDRPARFRITVDGAAPGDDHGADTDADGRGTVTGQRLRQFVRQKGAVADHRFEITFDPGVRADAFTSG